MQKKIWPEIILDYQPQDEQEREIHPEFVKAVQEDNILTRDNDKHHITVSAWVMDPEMNHVLMAYHLIYDSFSWLGGHADGETDLCHTALREAMEESGIREVSLFSREILSIEKLPVRAHLKKGKEVCAHHHLNVTFLLTAKTDQKLTVAPQENSAVEWIAVDELEEKIKEKEMLPLYRKLVNRARQWKESVQ